jgi:signal transduction histidine kinase
LQAIQYNDFSQSFATSELGSGFEELHGTFTKIIQQFQRSRMAKEEQFRYLQTIIQHVGVGLVSFRPDGRVDLINSQAKRLLHVPVLHNIQSLAARNPSLVDTLFHLRPGEKALVKWMDLDGIVQLSIFATEFKIRNEKYTLVSLQDIHGELEEKEAEAWQSLTRVLTHEIMNSITPIASLTSTVGEMVDSFFPQASGEGNDPTKAEPLEDIRSALQTILKRSQGLMHFVQAYRSLTLIPKPRFKIVPVAELFQRVEKLLSPRLQEQKVSFQATIDPQSLEITADAELIEQVLINLLLNGLDALHSKEEARLELKARMNERGRVQVSVSDNGPGIVADALDKVFIPFYTTKKEGSGIGLSFSRQVMRLHHGSIQVNSEPNVATTFTLNF